MLKREELLKTPEYWFETIQNEIFRQVSEYLESNEEMNQTKLAEKLGVTKGYVSQVMNGNFNYTLKKLIELSLAVNKAPVIAFQDLNEFVREDQIHRFNMQYGLMSGLSYMKGSTEIKERTASTKFILPYNKFSVSAS
ncbi:MAG: helix-turn-helix transcriptional regulator [Bacteroidia bacterium]|nr:helix-turn-helix transcriptional regulator [Bacteroidia bacterium]